MKTPFQPDTVVVPLDRLLPSRSLKAAAKSTRRYKMIAASVREVGLVEPVVVYPQAGNRGVYVILDGHVRVEVLRELGRAEVECLVATDDENCTYNVRVSHLAPIQEIRMILKAIKDGVSEEVIAATLNVKPKTIRESHTKLANIAPEALERLKDKPVADQTLRILKKVKPYRQAEMAELMFLSNTYTAPYARTLLATTTPDQLASPLGALTASDSERGPRRASS
jgi:ParB-like chromosome segregation protein Spo0J